MHKRVKFQQKRVVSLLTNTLTIGDGYTSEESVNRVPSLPKRNIYSLRRDRWSMYRPSHETCRGDHLVKLTISGYRHVDSSRSRAIAPSM